MKWLIVLVLCFNAFALTRSQVAYSNNQPYNSRVVWEDSCFLKGTASTILPIIWNDNGAHKTLLIEGWDTLIAGWASDTSAIKIEWLQAFPVTKEYGSGIKYGPAGYNKYVAILKSHANPDSTALRPISFVLYDSLVIKNMDTAAVYLRNAYTDTALTGNTVGKLYGDTAKTLQTTGFGAFSYDALPLDYSPARVLKITGLSTNNNTAPGTKWRFRIYEEVGIPVKSK